MNSSRRTVLRGALQIPSSFAILFVLGGCGKARTAKQDGAACANPDTMTDAEKSSREVVGYTEVSGDPQQVCAGCAFFHGGTGQCGTCDMFSGGAVNSSGHCASWSAKS